MPPHFIYINRGAAPFSWGNALKFDGVNDYTNSNIVIPNPQAISVWVKPIVILPRCSLFCKIGSSISHTEILRDNWVRINGQNIQFSTSVVNLNQWNHIYYWHDGVGWDAIVNGISSLGRQGGTTGISFQHIGVDPGQNNYFNGYMDELIFSSASSNHGASEGLALYNGGLGVNGDTVFTNYQAYYKFNESGTDLTAIDESGNYNATLINFPTSGMWVAH